MVINSFVFSSSGEQATPHAFVKQTLTPLFWPFYSARSRRDSRQAKGGTSRRDPQAKNKMQEILSDKKILTEIAIEALNMIVCSLSMPTYAKGEHPKLKLSAWKNPKYLFRGTIATFILHSELAWEVTENPQCYIFYHLPLGIQWETEFTRINYGPVIHTNPPVEGPEGCYANNINLH